MGRVICPRCGSDTVVVAKGDPSKLECLTCKLQMGGLDGGK